MTTTRKSLNFGPFVPNNKVLDKKIPQNPKYKNVKPAVDSGKSVRWYVDTLREQQKNSHYRKDEIFKRIRLSAFVKLIIAVGKEILFSSTSAVEDGVDLSHRDSHEIDEGKEKCSAKPTMSRSTICNVLMGIGEIDLKNEREKLSVKVSEVDRRLPYLLLDVRSQDEFLQCHIITAKNYPSSMLSRTVGYETPDMKKYKNAYSQLIVLYDEDELIATRVASTLVERGYENVYLLTGGLKLASEKFPENFIYCGSSTPRFPNDHCIAASSVSSSSKDFFTKEDIEGLQLRLNCYLCLNQGEPHKDQSSLFSKQSCNIQDANAKTELITSRSNRRGSAGSLKSYHAPLNSAQSCRSMKLNPGKKVPWK